MIINVAMNHPLEQLFTYTAKTWVTRAVALHPAFSAFILQNMRHLICLFVGEFKAVIGFRFQWKRRKVTRLCFSVWRGSDSLCFLSLDTVSAGLMVQVKHHMSRASGSLRRFVNKPQDWNQGGGLPKYGLIFKFPLYYIYSLKIAYQGEKWFSCLCFNCLIVV